MSSLFRRWLYFVTALLILPSLAPAQEREKPEERENPRKRAEFFYHVRSFPYGRIPQGARLDAIRYSDSRIPTFAAKRGRSLQSINQWHLIGPSNVGGRVNAIALHPTDGNTVWAGAASGGVWKSTDKGATWTAVMDFENAIWVGAITLDPADPRTVYVGTGDPTPSNGDSYRGAGIMRSTDDGATWTPIGLTNVGAITGIIIDPRNPNAIVASGHLNNPGIYRSVDRGANWTRISSEPISNMVANPQNPDQIWAATWSKGVIRSDDGGQTFVPMRTGLAADGGTLQRTSVAVARSNPSVLYVLSYEKVSGTDVSRLYKSTNAGAAWALVFDSRVTGNNFLGNQVQSQGWYNNVLEVKPDNENVAIAGGVTMVRTTNGGTSWPSTGGNVHVDHHSMAFDPSNPDVFYDGNDGGMYRSEDGGASFAEISTGLPVTQFYDLAIDQRASDLTYGGSQDNGTYAVGGGADNTMIAGGDGFFVLVDHSNSDIIYGEYPGGDLWKINRSNGQYLHITEGITDDAAWSAPLLQHPLDPNIILNGRTRVWMSFDGGGSWMAASPTVNGYIISMGISPVNPEIMYAGSERGSVIVSRNGGEDWEDVTLTAGLPARAVSDIAPSLTDPAVCYLSLGGLRGGHVFKTADTGHTWTDISRELPDITVNALAIHPDDANTIFAGTDIGVYVTTDGGLTWASYNNGLPRTEIMDIEIHKQNRQLRAATFGRSMWQIDLERPAAPPSVTSPQGGEVWTSATPRLISWQGFDGAVKVEYSVDDGANWLNVASDVAGNALRWIVPDAVTIAARVRVTSMANASQSATSRSFTIEKIKIGGILNQAAKPIIPYGLCYDGEYLWTMDFGARTMLKIDPVTLETKGAIQTQLEGGDSLFTDLAYVPQRGTIYVHKLFSTTSPGLGWLYEMTKDGRQVHRWRSPCAYPIGLAWMGSDNPDIPYLLATDRDGDQGIYLLDPETGATFAQIDRQKKVTSGPRGATSAGGGQYFYEIMTDFTGGSLIGAWAEKLTAESQTTACTFPIEGDRGQINARGIEFDPADSNVWVTDYSGNIYKMVTCEGFTNIPLSSAGSETAMAGFGLLQNQPNPFRDATEIGFILPRPAVVRIAVTDGVGRRIAQLGGSSYPAGTSHLRFDPAGLASGLYRYTLEIDGRPVVTRTMAFVR